MKIIKPFLVALLVATSYVLSAAEITPMSVVRTMVQKAGRLTVEQDCYIEGFIISKHNGRNNAMNEQVYHTTLKNHDLSTGYIESVKGDVGFRINFASRNMPAKFPRYAKVVLSLKGTTLECESPCRVTIKGLSDAHIVKLTQCATEDLPRKEKYISEITDDDVYTYLSLKDCEILFRDGSFLNVYERYVQNTRFNKVANPNKSMDGWATLICDKQGSSIYALLNTLCSWRRDGNGVPQGSGYMRGILTYEQHPRYGGDVFGGYTLRPVDKNDYAMDWEASEAIYRPIAEWNWNDNSQLLNTEDGEKKSVSFEKVLADVGKGKLSVKAEGKVTRYKDTNNPRVYSPKDGKQNGHYGFVNYGSLCVRTEAHNWWDWQNNCGKGVEIEFSTKGISGKSLIFGFSFAAGAISANTSYGYPVYWNVEYSTDGNVWYAVEGSNPKKLRTLPWWYFNDVYGSNYESIIAGAGLTEHMVKLPNTLFKQKNVYVRVVPVEKRIGTLGYDYNENGALRPNSMTETVINFGSFVVRYN